MHYSKNEKGRKKMREHRSKVELNNEEEIEIKVEWLSNVDLCDTTDIRIETERQNLRNVEGLNEYGSNFVGPNIHTTSSNKITPVNDEELNNNLDETWHLG